MATFANNLKLKILATGEGSGSWGTTTNNNLKQIAESLGYATQAVFSSNADQTITFPEDETTGIAAKSMYFKVTGSATLDATRNLTITNNDITRVMMVENATTGSQSIVFRQAGGSGSTVTIPNGRAKLIYMDGTGSNANVIDISAELSLTGVAIDGSSTFTGAITGSSYAGTINATSIEFDTLSGTGSVTITDILDEDNMASNSDTMLATQQSIKKYVDDQIQTVDTLSEILAQTSGNTTGGTKIEVNNTSGGIDLIDNAKIRFGTGDDLEIYHDGSDSIIAEATGTGDLLIRGNNLKLQKGDGAEDYLVATMNGSVAIKHDSATKLETTSSGIDVTGEVKGDTLDIDGNAAITGTVTIDPPLLTGATEGLGAKGIIMKQGDLRMKVDGDHDADGSGTKGGSLQNNSRIIFDSEQHEHEQHETLGFRNPAFVIQANYDHNNANSGFAGHDAGEEYLNANISQLGLGNLTISSGKLQLRGKVETPDDGAGSGNYNDVASGDDYIDHDSYMGITIDGSLTQGTVTRLHYGFINHNDRNMRLEPSVSGIIVEGMGDATGSGTPTVSNSGTIGTYNDIDLITLAQNQVTVAGELEATTLDINGAASIAGAVTDVTALTVDSIKIDGTTIGHTSDTDLLTLASQKLTITGDASGGGIDDSDHALVVSGAVTIKGTSDGGQLIIENSGSSSSDNPDIVLFNNNSGTASDGDKLGGLHFYGKDDAGNQTNYGVISAEIVDASSGSTEAGKIVIRPRTANSTATDILTILGDRVQVPDDIKMAFGDGSDLVISHKSANGNSVIRETGSGNLILQADDLTLEDSNGNKFIKGVEGGKVQVFHNAAAHATSKLETTSDGIQVNTDLLLFEEDSDSNANAGPTLTLQRKTSGTNPATNDSFGEIIFKGEDGAGNDTQYIRLVAIAADTTNTAEESKFAIQGIKAGSNENLILARSGLVSIGQSESTVGAGDRNANQAFEVNGQMSGKVNNTHYGFYDYGLELQGNHTIPQRTVTAISDASPPVCTTSEAHGYSTNDRIKFGTVGRTDINGRSFFITVTSTTQFTLSEMRDGRHPVAAATAISGITAGVGGAGFGIKILNTNPLNTHQDIASIEMSGNESSFIDLSKGDMDYGVRLDHSATTTDHSTLTSKTGDMVVRAETNGTAVKLQHEGANTKLETTDTGVAVTGKVTATVSAIGDNDVAVYGASVADDDFLRINGTDVEGRSASEVLSDIGAQASLTFGISNTNAVKVDSASVADDEYARFTANGLESRSTAEVLSDIGALASSGNAASATFATFAKGVLVDNAGNNVVEDETTNRDHDIVKTFVGKTFVYTGSGDITLGLPTVGGDIQIGEQIELINASTTDGAEIILDLNESGTGQTVRILTGSAAVDESSNDPHISDGGSVTLIGIAANTYVLFGAGIEDN